MTAPGWRFHALAPPNHSAAVALRNTTFAPIPVEVWRSFPALHAVVAEAPDGTLDGVLPLMTRPLVVAPERAVATAWAHSVCTRAEVRGQGIGAGLLAAARRVLGGRVDALCLYRGDETSAGYRFYQRNGLGDLLHVRRWRGEMLQSGRSTGAEIIADLAHLLAQEDALTRVFCAAHADLGGFIAKRAGWLAASLGSFYHTAHPQEYRLVCVRPHGELQAYALVARAVRPADGREARVLELAGPATDPVAWDVLLDGVARVAAGWRQPLECAASDESPAIPHLVRHGFQPARRSSVVMGSVLDPAAFAQQHVRFAAPLAAVRVEALTAAGDWVLHAPLGTTTGTIRLECEAATLTRLLLARVDVAAALGNGQITTACRDEGLLAAVGATFPRHPWCYHALDYL